MTIPEDSVFIRLLLLAVSQGKVEETYTRTAKDKVHYKASVVIGSGFDMLNNDDLKVDNIVSMEVVNYQPW